MRRSTQVLICLVTILLGVTIYQAFRIRGLSVEIAAVRSMSAAVVPRTLAVQSNSERNLAVELDAARKENIRLRQAAEGPQAKPTDGISKRVDALKDALKRLPEQQIPQLAYATDADWYAAVDGQLESAEDFRVALARLRASAEGRFAKLLQPALKAYVSANGGAFPQEVTQLQSFFGQPVDPAALQHYKIVRADELKSVRVGGEWAITQASVIDSDYDSHIVIGSSGYGSYGGPRR